MRRTAFLLVALLSLLALGASAAEAQERRTAADPGGAPAWTAEVRPGPGGQECAVLRRGRTVKGRSCARLTARAVFHYAVRRETDPDPRRWRTVYVVLLSRAVQSATLTTVDGVRTYRRGRGPRVLLGVVSGLVEKAALRVRVRVRAGRGVRTVTSGEDPGVVVADPLGEDPFRARVTQDDGRVCARWERFRRFTLPAGALLARGVRRCGDAGATIAVAAADRTGDRLVVFGVTDPRAEDVVLRAPDGSRPVRRDAQGAFLAVLPGGVDAASLSVVATRADGTRVTRAVTGER